jgi:hypothetical protein
MMFIAPVSDPRFTSAGKLIFFASSDGADGSEVGYVELSYSIRLYLKTPRSFAPITFPDSGVTVRGNDASSVLPLWSDYAVTDSIRMALSNSMSLTSVYSGLVSNFAEGSLKDHRGIDIPPGTRVWFRPATLDMNANANTFTKKTNNDAHISSMSLDKAFSAPLTWVGTSLTNGTFWLTDILQYA